MQRPEAAEIDTIQHRTAACRVSIHARDRAVPAVLRPRERRKALKTTIYVNRLEHVCHWHTLVQSGASAEVFERDHSATLSGELVNSDAWKTGHGGMEPTTTSCGARQLVHGVRACVRAHLHLVH